MNDIKEQALSLHEKNNGKLEIKSKVAIKEAKDLSIAYTPGVAYPCLEIKEDKSLAYKYTTKANMVCVLTDGSAVLGLGNIGPLAAIPVMEGKAILMKELAGIDSFPLCIDTQDTEEIIKTAKYIAPSFGAINLEDISAPRCVEIERRLINELDIPVFHDDQHGTAIIVGAAMLNVERLTNRKISEMKFVISGTGAAGSSIARHLVRLGAKTIYAYNVNGVVDKEKYDDYDFLIKELIDNGVYKSPENGETSLADILKGADVFIGVSAPNLVTAEMVKTMNKNPIIFAMANPTPEITPEEAEKGGAYIVGTGRSDYPNQINNCLAFPGIFRGALDAKATKITEEMKVAASVALANVVTDEELSKDKIVPLFNDERVVKAVAQAVTDTAVKQNVVRK
ncbi:MAG: NADP-dependent malic enzyme [Christensenellaceae bacterium]